MRTYEEIFREMFNEIYKSPEGWPDNLSITEVHNRAAKEYAKQWVDRCADVAMDNIAEGLPVGDAIYALKNEIDKQ